MTRIEQKVSTLWERFPVFGRRKSKEYEIIAGFPPVFLRLFGDINYQQQLKDVPEKFRQKVVILTTCDTSDETVNSLRADSWPVVRSPEVTTNQAKTSSSLLLNEAIRYSKEQKYPYLFFLASGFQRHLGMFYSMFYAVEQKHPNQEAYYFILPETHIGVSFQSHKQLNIENTEEFLSQKFPYETALFMSTSMPFFETQISPKGELGVTPEGIPLGGMEFFLTLLSTYRQAKDAGLVFAPEMIGITLPILTRSSQVLFDFYRRSRELPEDFLNSLDFAPSVEVTSAADKFARRIATFRAALARLNLTDCDVRKLFSHTQFEFGILEAFKFEDKYSSAI